MTNRGNPEPAELIAAAIESRLLNVRVSGIGIVQSYAAAKRTCTVQPATRRPIDTDDGETIQEDDAPIQNVMVAHLGSSALHVHHNLAAGDAVLLVYLDFSPAGWRKTGKVSDASDVRKSGPSYPVAIPFYRPSGGPGEVGAKDVNNSIGPPGGAARLFFDAAFVGIGDAAAFVARADKIDQELTTIKGILSAFFGAFAADSATATAIIPTVLGAAATAGTAVGSWPSGSVACSKLKTD